MADTIHLTNEGYKRLQERLEYLSTKRREEITEDIAVARSFGDLSENPEYDAAKEAQAQNEREIIELEAKLKNAVIIDESSIDSSVISMGSLVRISFIGLGIEDEYRIVGSAEVDIDDETKTISNDSPIGGGLLGAKVGEERDIMTPGGMMKVKVLDISL